MPRMDPAKNLAHNHLSWSSYTENALEQLLWAQVFLPGSHGCASHESQGSFYFFCMAGRGSTEARDTAGRAQHKTTTFQRSHRGVEPGSERAAGAEPRSSETRRHTHTAGAKLTLSPPRARRATFSRGSARVTRPFLRPWNCLLEAESEDPGPGSLPISGTTGTPAPPPPSPGDPLGLLGLLVRPGRVEPPPGHTCPPPAGCPVAAETRRRAPQLRRPALQPPAAQGAPGRDELQSGPDPRRSPRRPVASARGTAPSTRTPRDTLRPPRAPFRAPSPGPISGARALGDRGAGQERP